MAGDFSRAVSWGCGIIVGIAAAFGLGWLLCCGGCGLIFEGVGKFEEAKRRAEAERNDQTEAAIATSKTSIKPTPMAVGRPSTNRAAETPPETPEQIAAKEKARQQEAERHAIAEAEQEERRRTESEAAAKRDVERKASLAEADATTLLTLAKKLIETDKVAAATQLKSLIKQFPQTRAADEARKLLKSIN